MKTYIGGSLIAIAISLSGSENPLIPIAVMAAGIWLVREYIEWE